jgi:peptidoglycan LD-endopeptidase LytH
MTRVGRRRTVWREMLLLWATAAGALWLAWQLFQFTAQAPSGVASISTPSPTPAIAGKSSARTEATALPPNTATSLVDADVVELRRRQLPIPVVGIESGTLVPTFHQARGTGEHEALDIMAPRGTPVVAVEDGRIVKLFNSDRGGLTIYLFDPSETYCYYYAHLDRYADDVEEGGATKRGHTIGYVGSTGNAAEDAPHLHFAVFKLGPEKHWWQGTPIDPYLIWR